jgi:hypothetical protein
MNSAMFAGDFRSYAAEARFVTPLRFDNLERTTHVDTVRMQVVRFRPVASAQGGARTGADVLFFADLPTASMLKPLDVTQSSIETGLFVSDPRRRDVVDRRDTSLVRLSGNDAVSARSWMQHLAPGSYVYRVEAREPGSGRSARAQSPILVDPFPTTTLTMSDLLVARGLTPKPSSGAIRSYNDILVRPNAAMTFRRGDTLHVYWENYGLTGDKDRSGKLRVNVSLRADKLDRRAGAARARARRHSRRRGAVRRGRDSGRTAVRPNGGGRRRGPRGELPRPRPRRRAVRILHAGDDGDRSD